RNVQEHVAGSGQSAFRLPAHRYQRKAHTFDYGKKGADLFGFAEADKGVLFLIAMAGRLVAFGVQGIFFDLLAFPTAFHADTLASFMVVLVLVTKLTHARSLPTAIKVVVAAKVAALIAFYLLEMFFLFNL
ncbi:MAG: hypothetical protein R6V45_10795, partial [Oceanipulchritudo sp.]